MWRQWIQSPVRQGGEKSSGQNAPETQRIRTEYAHKINLLSQLLWCFHELAKGICKSNGTEVYLCFIDMISLEVKILISFTENVHNDGTLPRGFRQEVLKLVWDRGQMSYWVVKKKKKKDFPHFIHMSTILHHTCRTHIFSLDLGTHGTITIF